MITTVPPNTYIYEIKLYFIFNGTTERFLNQGFKLNVINIPPSTLKTKTLFDKNKKNLYILFSVRYYFI